MKHLNVFVASGRWKDTNGRGVRAIRAMSHGAKRAGYRVTTSEQDEGYVSCDIALMWGAGKRRYPDTMVRDDIVAQHVGPFVRIERGYWEREIYDSVSLKNLWGEGIYRFGDNSRAERMGMEPKAWRSGDGYVLVIGQVPWDTHCQHIKFDAWVDATKKRVEILGGGYPVRFRPHPQIEATGSLEEDLKGAVAVVTFNSTVGVDAYYAGIPTFFTDDKSMLSIHSDAMKLRDLARITSGGWVEGRTEFFHNLAWTQWRNDEMAEGVVWEWLGPLL